jgi:hypothetical protein
MTTAEAIDIGSWRRVAVMTSNQASTTRSVPAAAAASARYRDRWNAK